MTKLSRIVESGITYDFNPPVEIGDQQVKTIADMTRLALCGTEVMHPVASDAINLQVGTMLGALDELEMKEMALNELLAGKHEVRVAAAV